MVHLKRFSLSLAILISLSFCACSDNMSNLKAGLTKKEKGMPEAKYYSTDFSEFPDVVLDAISYGPISPDQALAFENINDLANPGYLEVENGYGILEDGSAYVAARTEMPGADMEMIQWWFWWHTLKNIRYKIWCPGDHYAIGAKYLDRYADPTLSPEEKITDNPHYPVEDVGLGILALSISFVPPETFGFDTSAFENNGVEGAICGIVGIKLFGVTIDHTYMCHLFRKTDTGLELRSRFWLGAKLDPAWRKIIFNEDAALGVMEHCSREYNHLASFLPDIYNEFVDSEE
ncbi:MAG: hydrolase [Proteobacteria bacterium]|nr:hydrolase [Pseudomonadota bacterium]